MMDYVELIKHVKQQYNAEDSAVIVFGGSYGGMLAAWLRIKYPATFQGALAASAPILQFLGYNQSFDMFSEIITDDFAQTYPDSRCSIGIKKGFDTLTALKDPSRSGDWAEMSSYLGTCQPITGAQNLTDL